MGMADDVITPVKGLAAAAEIKAQCDITGFIETPRKGIQAIVAMARVSMKDDDARERAFSLVGIAECCQKGNALAEKNSFPFHIMYLLSLCLHSARLFVRPVAEQIKQYGGDEYKAIHDHLYKGIHVAKRQSIGDGGNHQHAQYRAGDVSLAA